MERNKLRTISSYLFSNNRQKMSISLAYNQLSFENRELHNNSWIVNRVSPFAGTYNLRLLNLSHNNFKRTFQDWWINGHDILDISHNSISSLWVSIINYKTSIYEVTFAQLLNIMGPIKRKWSLNIKRNVFTYLFQDNENSNARYGYRKIFKKPLKEAWVSNNVFQCRCTNYEFIDFLKDELNTKVCIAFYKF